MVNSFDLRSILQQFGLNVDQWSGQAWQGNGFSGSRIWRLRQHHPSNASPGESDLCLRRHRQADIDINRIQWQLGIIQSAVEYDFILQPRPTLTGNTCLLENDHLWLIEPWAVGKNDFHQNANRQRFDSVLKSLAQLHLCWFANSQSTQAEHCRLGPSPGLQQRLQIAQRWLDHGDSYWESIQSHVLQLANPAWQLLAAEIQANTRTQLLRLRTRLQTAQHWQLPLGPVLGDPWSDHLFFVGNQLTAVIDYQTIRWDCVAADLSRVTCSLLGQESRSQISVNPTIATLTSGFEADQRINEQDLLPNAADWKRDCLEAYQSTRPLSSLELDAKRLYDQSSLILGPLLWLGWVFLERRFSPEDRLLDRIRRISQGQPF